MNARINESINGGWRVRSFLTWGSFEVPEDKGAWKRRKPSPSVQGKRTDERVSLRVTHRRISPQRDIPRTTPVTWGQKCGWLGSRRPQGTGLYWFGFQGWRNLMEVFRVRHLGDLFWRNYLEKRKWELPVTLVCWPWAGKRWFWDAHSLIFQAQCSEGPCGNQRWRCNNVTMCVTDKQSSKVLVGKRPGPRREGIF